MEDVHDLSALHQIEETYPDNVRNDKYLAKDSTGSKVRSFVREGHDDYEVGESESNCNSDSEESSRNNTPYLESSALEFPHQSFPCAMMIIQFFEFYGDTLATLSIEVPSIPSISKLCASLISEDLVDDDSKLLNSCGSPLFSFIELQDLNERDQDWLKQLNSFQISESNASNEDHQVVNRLGNIINKYRHESSADLKSLFASQPMLRIELFYALLDVASESNLLRMTHDMRMAKTEENHARKIELENSIREIDEQAEDFAIQAGKTILEKYNELSNLGFSQTCEEWREAGGFRLFQIIGPADVLTENMISCDVKEWSPGQDVLEGGQSKVGEQRFSVPSKSVRRVCFSEACWFPVTVNEHTKINVRSGISCILPCRRWSRDPWSSAERTGATFRSYRRTCACRTRTGAFRACRARIWARR